MPVLWLASRSSHRPDLVVLRDDGPIAIEIELTLKAPRRLGAILYGYEEATARGAFLRVGYVVEDEAGMAGIRRAASIVGIGDRLVLLPFEEIQSRARKLAGGKAWAGR